MKNVGHGDCYVVISDGRIVVIDVGPTSSADGLVAFLKGGYFHYDRIVITHVHSDHASGLMTAGEYARQKGSVLSAGMFVSNHGEHDVDVVIRESKLRALLASLRSQPVVAMDDQALAKLAFADENMAIEGFTLNKSKQSKSENASGLVLKVTEIRDGQRRATLFLGDIGKSEQARLFSRPDARDIFRDVGAVTLPHHGRSTTLHRDFFDCINALGERRITLLHSDRKPLNRRVATKAAEAGFTVKSTADAAGGDVLVNLFGSEKTFHVVESGTTDLAEIVAREEGNLTRSGRLRTDEVLDAVSRFCNRPPTDPLSANTVISWPSDAWILKEVAKERDEFNRETERLISQLQSTDARASAEAEKMLDGRRPRLSQAQRDNVDKITQEAFDRETERLILQLQSLAVEESTAAERALAARRARLSQVQIERIDGLVHDATARRHMENEILEGLRSGWYTERNPNINNSRLFLYGSKAEQERSTGLRYVVEEGSDRIWEVHEVGPIDSIGISTPGRSVVRMKRPSETTVVDRRVCEYCGKTAYGLCTMRHKYVCESHRYFTQGTTRWRCP
jgi:beta-lactamase superfamily II metal-dependent hydrolase